MKIFEPAREDPFLFCLLDNVYTEIRGYMANPLKKAGVNNYQFYVYDEYEYVITILNTYKDKNFPLYKKSYNDLFLNGEVIKKFDHVVLNLPGPTVKIIKIN